MDNLEVTGFGGFVHVRCPWAPSEPCRCGRYSCHPDSLVVAVDGACPGNGSPNAVASGVGVYFGDSDDDCIRRNLSFPIPDNYAHPHTSQRAELHAAIAGVKSTMCFAADGGQWPCGSDCPEPCKMTHLVIKSDSAYLVNGITQSINKWMQNGWLTVKRTPVRNRDLWEELLKAIDMLDDFDVSVVFWLVPREQNADANKLAASGVYAD